MSKKHVPLKPVRRFIIAEKDGTLTPSYPLYDTRVEAREALFSYGVLGERVAEVEIREVPRRRRRTWKAAENGR